MASDSKELARELREASLAFASKGPWMYRDGLFIPRNVCSETADLILWATDHVATLEDKIALLQYEIRNIPLIRQGSRAG
jgi:hypothetical protein